MTEHQMRPGMFKIYEKTISGVLGDQPELLAPVMSAIRPLLADDWRVLVANVDQSKRFADEVRLCHDYEDKVFTVMAAIWNNEPDARNRLEAVLEELYPPEWREEAQSRDWRNPDRMKQAGRITFPLG